MNTRTRIVMELVKLFDEVFEDWRWDDFGLLAAVVVFAVGCGRGWW